MLDQTPGSPIRSDEASPSSHSLESPKPLLTPNRSQVHWKKTFEEIEKIKRFLFSLDSASIGGGFVIFNLEKFCLDPCSQYFNNHFYQWIVNYRNPQATFDGVTGGFADLSKKVKSIKKTSEQFSLNTPEECSPEIQKLCLKLIGISLIIPHISKGGLNRLCDNYQNSWNREKNPAGLRDLGNQIFTELKSIMQDLEARINAQCPEFYSRTQLRRHHIQTDQLIGQRDLFIGELRKTRWTIEEGVIFSDLCIEHAFKTTTGKKPTSLALRVASKAIHLPNQAQPIPIHRKSESSAEHLMWIPVRPEIGDDDQLMLSSGVFGTCEREGGPLESVCNVYTLFHPDIKQLVLGCGAIDTPLKARQMAAVLANKLSSCARPRFVIHQLNSWFNETDLLGEVHLNRELIEFELNRVSHGYVKVLHFNTAFNAAAQSRLSPYENSRSVDQINIDSLALLIDFVVQDLYVILDQSITLNSVVNFSTINNEAIQSPNSEPASDQQISPSQSSEPSSSGTTKIATLLGNLQEQFSQLKKLVDEIQGIKKGMSRNTTPVMSPSRYTTSSSSTSNLTDSDSLETPLSLPLTSTSDETVAFLKESSSMKELSKLLNRQQLALVKLLKTIALETLPVLIDFFQFSPTVDTAHLTPLAKQATLILTALKELYCTQLYAAGHYTMPKQNAHSRCTEIELFLLLYRLLNINPIITCWSGLDRSGFVRAMADAQLELERQFVERIMQADTNESIENARVKARELLLKLIVQCDHNRNNLFIFIKNKNQVPLISDSASWTTVSSTETNPKQLIFDDAELDQIPGCEGQLLRDTLNYLELVYRHLIGSEKEKTLFSTGVLGFKYHHSVGRAFYDPRSMAANPFPVERMPLFVSTESGKRIQIVSFDWSYLSWSYEFSFTPIGLALTEELSQFRGT